MTELSEARRRAVELRASLAATERDLSDVRHSLGGGQDPSALAKRLGVQARGLTDGPEDMRALARLKPELVAKIERTETAIGIAQARVLELEAAEPSRQAAEVASATAALAILPRFVRAGLEADQSLRAFVAAIAEMKTVAREMQSVGHPVANETNMRIAFDRIVGSALSAVSTNHTRSPGASNLDTLASAWAQNARLRIEALLAANTSTVQLEEVA